MLPEKSVLTRRQHQVEIGGRTFLLEEHSAADVQRYMQLQLSQMTNSQAMSQAVAAGDIEAAKAAGVEAASLGDELLAWLLPGTDAEWREANLSPSIRKRIVEIQDELNAMDEIVGNLKSLLLGTPAA